MKKILFICSALFLIGCGSSDKDCNCTQQKYQRLAVYTIPSSSTPSTFVSASEWVKTGNSETAGNNCDDNGKVKPVNSGNDVYNPTNNTVSRMEYEYRVTCQ